VSGKIGFFLFENYFWPDFFFNLFFCRHEEVSGPALDQRAIAAWPELQAALTSKYRAALENFSMGVTSCVGKEE
jgi:hypothetical protein